MKTGRNTLATAFGSGLGGFLAVALVLSFATAKLQNLDGNAFERDDYLRSGFFLALALGPVIGCYLVLKFARRTHPLMTAMALLALLPFVVVAAMQILITLSSWSHLHIPEDLPDIPTLHTKQILWASMFAFFISFTGGFIARIVVGLISTDRAQPEERAHRAQATS